MSATEIEQPSAGPYIAFSSSKIETVHTEDVSLEQQAPVLASDIQDEEAAPTSEAKTLDFSSEPLPAPPVFTDKYKEREYLKTRLTLAFRVFAKMGFDCGIAGHITLRVRMVA
jgi:hypothetical protein